MAEEKDPREEALWEYANEKVSVEQPPRRQRSAAETVAVRWCLWDANLAISRAMLRLPCSCKGCCSR